MSLNISSDFRHPMGGSLEKVSIKSAETFAQALTIAEILASKLEGNMLLYKVKWANSWIEETMLKDIFSCAPFLIKAFNSVEHDNKRQNGELIDVSTNNVNFQSSEHEVVVKHEEAEMFQGIPHEFEGDEEKNGTLYMCDICNISFNSHQSLSNHKYHSHVDADGEQSSSMIPVYENMGDNISTETSLTKQLWEQGDDSLANTTASANGNTLYECGNCHMTFADEEYLSRHQVRCKNHTNSEYRCGVCFRGFTTKGSLELHVSAVHLKKKDFGCSICGKLFSRKHILKIHLATHYGERNFQCATCGKTFVQKSNYNRHIRIHEAKNFGYKCRYCGQTFTQNKHVEKHIRAYHTEKHEEPT